MQKDSAGVAPLRSQRDTFSNFSDKAKILNNLFSSVFTQESTGSMPDKGPSSFPSIPQIEIPTPRFKQILDNLKPPKASGPDSIPPMVLKELSNEISNEISIILQIIFQNSLTTGQVPDDWK